MKKNKCLCCGKRIEFNGLCSECRLPLKERLALKEKRDKIAIDKFQRFMKKTFGDSKLIIEK